MTRFILHLVYIRRSSLFGVRINDIAPSVYSISASVKLSLLATGE